MKNYRLYLYTAIGFSVLFLLLCWLATPQLIAHNISTLLDSEIAAGKQQARQLSELSGQALSEQMTKEAVIKGMQMTIEGSETENLFLSVFDWSGKIISYPERARLGTKEETQSATISNIESSITGDELYTHFLKDKDKKEQHTSEIIYMMPIPHSDWIVATHINMLPITQKISALRSRMHITFLVIGLFTLLFVLGALRFISSFYEEQLAQKTTKLEDGVLNLAKLNASLDNYQKNIAEIREAQAQGIFTAPETDIIKEPNKQRILTYVRNELMPVAIEDVAYIYVDNTITYVVRRDGKRSTMSESLDQIFSSLDSKLFFRANRQNIVAIHAIHKITKFGNSALKIQTQPISEVDIVIGKNKAAAFKQWLDL